MAWMNIKDILPDNDRDVVVMISLPVDRRSASAPYKITLTAKYMSNDSFSWWSIRDGDTDMARNITHWIDYPKD